MIAFAFLLALLTMCDLSIAPSSSSVCHKRNSCKCVNDDGMGYDLEVLGTSKYALETLGRDESNLTFYFHPCGDIDIEHHPIEVNKTAEICKASSLCLYNHTVNQFVTLGYAKDSEYRQSGDQIFIVFKQSDNLNVTTIIQLGCSNVLSDHLVEDQSEFSQTRRVSMDKTQYNLVLYSTHACQRQLETIEELSTGSVIVITFFSLIISYLVLGMAINHFWVGASGIETIPNLSFWIEFPALDGIAFIQNGCRPVDNNELLTPRTPNPDSYVSI